jgi:hypothetical protein
MIFNYWTREFLEIKEGEEICSECEGYGTLLPFRKANTVCLKCFGHGKLDWIEKVTGKKDLAIGVIEL